MYKNLYKRWFPMVVFRFLRVASSVVVLRGILRIFISVKISRTFSPVRGAIFFVFSFAFRRHGKISNSGKPL